MDEHFGFHAAQTVRQKLLGGEAKDRIIVCARMSLYFSAKASPSRSMTFDNTSLRVGSPAPATGSAIVRDAVGGAVAASHPMFARQQVLGTSPTYIPDPTTGEGISRSRLAEGDEPGLADGTQQRQKEEDTRLQFHNVFHDL